MALTDFDSGQVSAPVGTSLHNLQLLVAVATVCVSFTPKISSPASGVI